MVTALAADGHNVFDVRIRELHEGETDVLRRVFQGLTDDQRALRYGTGLPRLTRAHLDVLCATDGVRHVAFVAEVDAEPVAIARYIVVGPGTAEVAVEVVDRFSGQGIARRVLSQLVEAARARGISRFTMDIVGSNHRAAELARDAGARLRLEAGAYSGVLSLDRPSRSLHAISRRAATSQDAHIDAERAVAERGPRSRRRPAHVGAKRCWTLVRGTVRSSSLPELLSTFDSRVVP